MADTIRQQMLDIIRANAIDRDHPVNERTVDTLLASPLADIIDLAAEMELTFGATASLANFPPEVRALLADWREGRS